ncbi:anthocyanidin 3-O-glucosyltransferase 6-like isoform X1 [Rhodamnia argentea]|uniref:Glycosyltransferase n=1 Tax=Rhodamnia argentea TaxID=178133 RepID=A0A8B8MVP5_9MYRT|nr:anthocyanidin 3-O-glucosyltransferase 6-like isoform X1 [Rhodamnia argentea]
MVKAELVFVPSPGFGHLVSTVEMAKLLIDRDPHVSITLLIMKPPYVSHSGIDDRTRSLANSMAARFRFVHLPDVGPISETNPSKTRDLYVESYKPHVREAIARLTEPGSGQDSPRLAGLVVDMFCTTMIDVANELRVPSYVFFTSSAAFLGLMFHLQRQRDEQGIDSTEFRNSDTELDFPIFANKLPAKVLPTAYLVKEAAPAYIGHARRFRETKGIFVNTFAELEAHVLESLVDDMIPPVYPVGPILNLTRSTGGPGPSNGLEIMKWLDNQPRSSVVFLCFGSRGSFDADAVREFATALERCGHRFLWSLREPPPKGKVGTPRDYANLEEILPEGFLDRTVKIGKVIGWAPQVDILAHPAVGGFVSHCGWNSTLESIWFDVPIAGLPLYAEQQFNAFEMVVELDLAVEIKMEYRRDVRIQSETRVTAEEIERGIRQVMEIDSARRKKVKEMSEKSRKALDEGGSSCSSLRRLIGDIFNNMPR